MEPERIQKSREDSYGLKVPGNGHPSILMMFDSLLLDQNRSPPAQVPKLSHYILRMANAATPAGSASSRPASIKILRTGPRVLSLGKKCWLKKLYAPVLEQRNTNKSCSGFQQEGTPRLFTLHA